MNGKLVAKVLIIGAMTLTLMIALFMISGVVDDRQHFRDDAVQSIEASYAGQQTLIGPVLVEPYTQITKNITTDSKGVKTTSEDKQELSAISFPHLMNVDGSMLPGERRHGLYKVEVYELNGHIRGNIVPMQQKLEGEVTWGEPYLAMSVTDVRGLVATPQITVNGTPASMMQGAPATSGWQPNLRIPLARASSVKLTSAIDFDISLKLAGTGTLSVAPLADSNQVQLKSSWRSPLFAGQFLPQTPQVSDAGFHARWDVPSLATGTQMQLLRARPDKGENHVDVISVSLTNLIDPYTLSSRAVKYGILFILLTFGGFFLVELGRQLPIHPVQYMLVGLELAVFFLLLVSFSEHMAFGLAYLLASAASIGLLTFYLSHVLRSVSRALGFGAMLTTLYAAVYGLLVSEDDALVLGALLLFVLLAVVMVLTRKVDWYRGANAAPPPLPAQL